MNNDKSRKDIIEVGRELLETKLVARTWGNISARADSDNFLITPSGLDYISMTEEDIVCVNMTTGEWSTEHRPSGERGVHKASYEVFDDVNFVVHTHQTYATAIALAGYEEMDITDDERKKLGGIATAEYGLPGTDKLTNAVKEALLTGAHTVLMLHHGVLVLGKDRAEAMERTRLLEEICKRNVKCRSQAIVNEQALNTLTDKFKHDADAENKNTDISKQDGGILKSNSNMSEQEISILNNGKYFRIISTAELIEVSLTENVIVSQLDDVSQMVGTEVITVAPEDVIEALEKTNAVLVSGTGAVVRADSSDDAEALSVLMQKMAVVKLHTKAYNEKAEINREESDFMHYDYVTRYSKQKK